MKLADATDTTNKSNYSSNAKKVPTSRSKLNNNNQSSSEGIHQNKEQEMIKR